MNVYHGSIDIIKQPVFGKGKSYNDFGKGFYCTPEIELAKEWACSDNSDGYANCYELDMADLKVLNLNESKYNILNWLYVLTKHRSYWQSNNISSEAKEYLQEKFAIDFSDYDIIIGYRADDSYFSFAQDFVANTISLERLSIAMHLGKLGEQIVLKSEKAFSKIRFIKADFADKDTYYPKKRNRDQLAKKQYREIKKYGLADGLYMADIIRGGMTNDSPRLQRGLSVGSTEDSW